jgi:hypothetical protein
MTAVDRDGLERRWTKAVFTVGTLGAAACLLAGLVLTLLGRPTSAGDPLDLAAVSLALAELRPWGWSMAGVLILLLTPPAGLLATLVELRRSAPYAAWLVVAVLGVLVAAVVIAAS